ncbi:MAG: penicillin-binding protein 2 [Alphaproteobacteria bacterium]|nr:penicillin-binding protein 2 [Alphaproteobacteria bacterium]
MKLWRKSASHITYAAGTEIPLATSDRYRFLNAETVAALHTGRTRLFFVMFCFTCLFSVLLGALFYQTILKKHIQTRTPSALNFEYLPVKRADIVDRTGVVIATTLPTVDVYVDAREIDDPEKMADDLIQILPSLKKAELLEKLKSKNSFKYLKRNLTPTEQFKVNALGYPQLNFVEGERRVYPQGSLFAHILGITDIDNQGIAGVEKAFNERLTTQKEPLTLSVHTGIQNTVHHELENAIKTFRADAGAAIVFNVKNGEILALTSLPDYEPNLPSSFSNDRLFNRATVGVYEVGSVMKLFTVAIGLETKSIVPTDSVDATKPLAIGKRPITDFQPQSRMLTIPEVLIYSSNIGTAQVILKVGAEKQKEYLKKCALLDPVQFELPEKAAPLKPSRWSEVDMTRISYGYALSISPLHIAASVSSLVNGGLYNHPTILKDGNKGQIQTRVFSEKTSQIMRHMMRAVADIGSGKRANIKGYRVGGKTGSAQLTDTRGRYIEGKVRTSFVGVFPMDDPQYLVLVMLENPQKRKEDWYFNSAGWNAAPTGGKIIEAIAPQLGITPKDDEPRPQYMQRAYDIYHKKDKR